jgi:hypothetical protein
MIRELMLGSTETISKERLNREKEATVQKKQQPQGDGAYE